MKRDKFKDTQAERVNDLLNSQSYPMQSFAVPRFQRNYAWKDEADRLWADMYDYYIEHKEETVQNLFDGQYMLGPMVILRDDGGGEDGYEWLVIDGQQRLATLTTLFCVIRDIFSDLKNKHDEEGYKLARNLVEKETFKDERAPKLKLNQKDRDFFASRIQKEGDPVEKMAKWQGDIKGKKRSAPTSHKLLMRCYEVMYNNVCDALITGFAHRSQIEGEMAKKEIELKNSITNDMVKNPAKYSLPNDFFEEHWDGKEFVQDGKVSENERREYDRLKLRPRGSKHRTVSEYVEYVIIQKENKFKKTRAKAVEVERPSLLMAHGAINTKMLTKFLKYVIQQNFVVSARVENENDASMIFEALNARGKRLSKSELVKNMCFRVVKDEKEIIELDLLWSDIFNEELKSGDSFIRESLRSRHFQKYQGDNSLQCDTSTANILKIISDMINGSDANAKKYVAELEVDSKFTKMMDTPTSYSDDEEIKYNLVALGRLNAVHIRIPLLTAYREWELGEEFNRLFGNLIKFHFRNITVGDMHTSKMEKIMLDVAKKVNDGMSLAEINIDLRKKDLGDDEFEERFFKLEIDEGESIKYILLEIESYLRGNDQVIQLEADATVEHVLPKKPSKDWIEDEFFRGLKDDDDHDFKPYSKRIGNMTLLSKSPNSRVKNRSFCLKKTEAYAQEETLKLTSETVLKMVKCEEELEKSNPEFQNIKEWTAAIIVERSKCFAKLAKMIWSL